MRCYIISTSELSSAKGNDRMLDLIRYFYSIETKAMNLIYECGNFPLVMIPYLPCPEFGRRFSICLIVGCYLHFVSIHIFRCQLLPLGLVLKIIDKVSIKKKLCRTSIASNSVLACRKTSSNDKPGLVIRVKLSFSQYM